MKLLLDFFPIALFFVAFKLWGIYIATGVAIAATVAQIAWFRYSTGKVEAMQWLSLGIIVVFGGATILLHNEDFIKWKPTVLYWLMGGSLAIGLLGFRKNLLKSVMGAQLELPETAWRAMTWSWVVFFAVMGVVNLWVAFNFDTATWVNFKLFGGLGLMAVFVIGQALYLGRYMKDGKEAPAEKP
ncbi:MAG: intracellular septation protein-like protein [Ramlibacter sp.]|nr:intracellular septation protein-like protein [Ramlibacter sp.]